MFVGLHTRLRPGAEEEYDRLHAQVWPEVRAGMRRVGISRYRIFRDGVDLFHYIECDDYTAAMSALADDPTDQRWQATVAPLMEVPHDMTETASDRLTCIFDIEVTGWDGPGDPG